MSKNLEYCSKVAAGDFNLDTFVPLDDAWKDERGEIRNVVQAPIGSVSRLGSRRGSVRANHWHRTDWHYALVEYGRVLYFERAIGDTEIPVPRMFTAGEMFFTPPNREHAMLFVEDTALYTFQNRRRTHEEHEADLVRVEFVTPAVVDRYLP